MFVLLLEQNIVIFYDKMGLSELEFWSHSKISSGKIMELNKLSNNFPQA